MITLSEIKTVSAEHPSNKGKNKVTKKITHDVVTFCIQLHVRRNYEDFSSQADPVQEKIEFEVAHILLKINVSRKLKTK